MKGAEKEPHYLFPKPYADAVQRLRVLSGFLLLLAFAWFSKPLLKSIAIGLPISLLGLSIRGWAAGHLVKNQQLATGGPFAYVRNPLYVGTLITALGIVIAARSAALAVIFFLVFMLVYLPVIELEEQHLRTIFPTYAAYAAVVHRFLPLTKFPGGKARFSPSIYMRNQEYKAAAGLALAAAWLLGKYWFDLSGI